MAAGLRCWTTPPRASAWASRSWSARSAATASTASASLVPMRSCRTRSTPTPCSWLLSGSEVGRPARRIHARGRGAAAAQGSGALRQRAARAGLRRPGGPVAIAPEVVRGTDMVILRERRAVCTSASRRRCASSAASVAPWTRCPTARARFRRIVERAFEWAAGRRRKVLSVDKFNVLVTGRFWRDIANDIAGAHPRHRVRHDAGGRVCRGAGAPADRI